MNRTGQLLCTITCIIDGFGEITVDVVDGFVAHDHKKSAFSVAHCL